MLVKSLHNFGLTASLLLTGLAIDVSLKTNLQFSAMLIS